MFTGLSGFPIPQIAFDMFYGFVSGKVWQHALFPLHDFMVLDISIHTFGSDAFNTATPVGSPVDRVPLRLLSRSDPASPLSHIPSCLRPYQMKIKT